MNQQKKQEIASSIQGFHLPRYHELPDGGLYLEQTTRYISEYLYPLEDTVLTSSMISNYVKKDLIANPVKKMYYREQIAHLVFISLAKTVISIDDLRTLLELQRSTYLSQVAYDYFCSEFENVLYFIFGIKDTVDDVGVEDSDEKLILRNIIITIAHKIYVNKYLLYLKNQK